MKNLIPLIALSRKSLTRNVISGQSEAVPISDVRLLASGKGELFNVLFRVSLHFSVYVFIFDCAQFFTPVHFQYTRDAKMLLTKNKSIQGDAILCN